MVIVLGLFGGKFAKYLKLPKVSGYLLIGLLIGPSALNFVTAEIVENITIINDLALGMILFAIGGIFERHHFEKIASDITKITLLQSLGGFVLVTLGVYLVSGDLFLASLLGALGIATAPGAVLLVVREYNAKGDFTDTLLYVVALSNVLCIIVFEFILSAGTIDSSVSLMMTIMMTFGKLFGAILVGFLMGAFVSWWENKVEDQAELILIFIAGILIVIGLCKTFGLNPLLASLVMGAVTINISMMHRLIYVEMRQTEQPLYIAFFVISGASLHFDLLWSLGAVGLAYLILRVAGKWLTLVFFSAKLKLSDTAKKYLGPSLVTQAGVAIGLVHATSEIDRELGQTLGLIIYSTVIVYEVLGPPVIRWSLIKAGDVSEGL